jgi:hypothetical protein
MIYLVSSVFAVWFADGESMVNRLVNHDEPLIR